MTDGGLVLKVPFVPAGAAFAFVEGLSAGTLAGREPGSVLLEFCAGADEIMLGGGGGGLGTAFWEIPRG